jgi:glycosyltransferase involved in cell wall biosynthesis
MEKVSVVIPAYNEEQAIAAVLARLQHVVDES